MSASCAIVRLFLVEVLLSTFGMNHDLHNKGLDEL